MAIVVSSSYNPGMRIETQTQTTARIRARFFYALGAVLRVVVVTALLVLGYAALGHGAGEPVLDFSPDLLMSHLLVAVPFAIVACIAESQIVLLRGMGFSATTTHVLVPTAFALVGAYFGYLRFVAPHDLVGPFARMFILGSVLLFFLAGSFHVWSWHAWMSYDPGPTPMLWYVVLLCVTGSFFGSCVAASAPSPYLIEIVEYREQVWSPDRKIDPAERLPIEEVPGY